MGYYVRVLSTSAKIITLDSLRDSLKREGFAATLSVEGGTEADWSQLLLAHDDGREIAEIERNPIEKDSLGADELNEFRDEISDKPPASAAQWLMNYFPKVKCIHAFRLLSGTDHKNGWDILGSVKNEIWSSAPSIMQADGEGFSNEEGYHILWQFSDTVSGPWWMGVLRNGAWVHFEMDLGNRKHREAFFEGKVPDGVVLA